MTARDALLVVGIVFFVLVILVGGAARNAAEDMPQGWERDIVLAITKPADWVSSQTPLEDWVADATDPLKTGDDLGDEGGFDDTATPGAGAEIPPVTPEAFDPVQLGAEPVAPRELDNVLVTGDSMSMPLDSILARRLADSGIKVDRDPHVGTGLSITGLVDWGKLSTNQVEKKEPEAIVVFLGANEGFPLKYAGKEVDCCGPEWAAAYANRARRVMDTYRQAGQARVYWLLLPGPRDPDRIKIAKAVNYAVTVAASPYGASVRLLDMTEIFTPDYQYRDAMDVDGTEKLVRRQDGIHLNDDGSEIAADEVLEAMRADFGDEIPEG
jgi:hypothetical protein